MGSRHAIGDVLATESIDVLRLSPRKVEQLVSEITRKATLPRDSCNRLDQRYPCHDISGQVVEITHPGGTKNLFLIPARNISRGGLAFFHGGFVYEDSRCRFLLKTPDDQRVGINGKVVRCTPVEGRIHEVGVQFDQTIDINLFISNAVEPVDIGTTSQPLPRLRGRILMIDTQRERYEILRGKLEVTGARLMHAQDLREAQLAIRGMATDLIITTLDVDGTHASQVIEKLRGQGFDGPVVACTAQQPSSYDRERLAAVECRDMIAADGTVHDLASALARFIALPAA